MDDTDTQFEGRTLSMKSRNEEEPWEVMGRKLDMDKM